MPEQIDTFWRALFFVGPYNTRLVLAGTMLLGFAAGMLGTFLVLRKRSLLSDALGHAALPGVCVGFLVALAFGFDGRSPLWLLAGAAVFGFLGVATVHLLTTLPRVREDAAIGIVLSVFFAGGIVLLGVIQRLPTGRQAGLDRLIFGQAATMQLDEVVASGVVAALVLLTCLLGFRRFRLLCFDPAFARSIGWSTGLLDAMLLAATVLVTIAGLYAVGAILIVALLIIPAASARFWTDRLGVMLLLAGFFGASAAWIGAAASAVAIDLPTGPAIVVACGLWFILSMLAGTRRGLLLRWKRRRRTAATVPQADLT